MSNTRHSRPYRSLRSMRVQNRRKAEASALDEMLEEGVPARHINRLQSYWAQIPEPWDDKPHAAGKEYHNKNYWTKWREERTAPRYSKRTAQKHLLADTMGTAIAAGI